MSKLNSQKFSVEGFKEQKDWIGKLLSPLNQFIGEAITAFNNGISVEDNLFAELKEIKFVNSPTNFPLNFQTKFSTNPKGLNVVYCYDNTASEMNFSQAVWCNWAYENNSIKINSITGLTAGHTYTLRVYVIYK